MKKKIIFLAGITIIAGAIFVYNSTENKETLNNVDTAEDKDTLSDTEVAGKTHTVTLQHAEPVRVGDQYGWMLVSEPGQLGYCLNVLGISHQDPAKTNELLGEDETTITYPQDSIDLDKICNKLGLDKETLLADLADNKPITITYS